MPFLHINEHTEGTGKSPGLLGGVFTEKQSIVGKIPSEQNTLFSYTEYEAAIFKKRGLRKQLKSKFLCFYAATAYGCFMYTNSTMIPYDFFKNKQLKVETSFKSCDACKTPPLKTRKGIIKLQNTKKQNAQGHFWFSSEEKFCTPSTDWGHKAPNRGKVNPSPPS